MADDPIESDRLFSPPPSWWEDTTRNLQILEEESDIATFFMLCVLFGIFGIFGLVILVYIMALIIESITPRMDPIRSRMIHHRHRHRRTYNTFSADGERNGRSQLVRIAIETRKDLLETLFAGKPYSKELVKTVENARRTKFMSTQTKDEQSPLQDNTECDNCENLSYGSNDESLSDSKEMDSLVKADSNSTTDKCCQDSPSADTTVSCLICLSPYEDGDDVLISEACYHMFHKSCLLEWLKQKDDCPYCRRTLALALNKGAGGQSAHIETTV